MVIEKRLRNGGGQRLQVATLVAVAIALSAAFSACGSGGDAESSEKVAAANEKQSVHPSPDPALPATDRHPQGGPPSKERAHTRKSSPQASDSRPPRPRGLAHRGERGERSCPPEFTRAQCREHARAAAKDAPSHEFEKPRDCLDSMSRADCEALLEAQSTTAEDGGGSFRPEDCLDEHTRRECEEIFEAMGQAPK